MSPYFCLCLVHPGRDRDMGQDLPQAERTAQEARVPVITIHKY